MRSTIDKHADAVAAEAGGNVDRAKGPVILGAWLRLRRASQYAIQTHRPHSRAHGSRR
jgi:hypothetical protein